MKNHMTVRELIEKLSACDPDLVVIMAIDAESNDYAPLAEVDAENNSYIDDNRYGSDVQLRELTDELRAQGFSEDDVDEDGEGVPCLVLWPR